MTTAVVAAALANKPWNGGNAWARLGFVIGLQRLGFGTLLIEQLAAPTPDTAFYFASVCEQFGVEGVLLTDASPSQALLDRAEDAAVLVNVGGHLDIPALVRAPRRRIFVDDDPVYTQAWHAQGQLGERLAGYDAYFSVGLNIGREGRGVARDGIDWLPLLPPVPLAEWAPADGEGLDRFTTIASWRGAYGPLEHAGATYGQKAHEFRKLVELPQRAGTSFELALDIHQADAADRALLESHGWVIVDPREVAGTPDAFRDYVRGSGAEFSAAQGAYVATESGWFSDRTAKYLACGRPALVQDTGLGRTLQVGDGLVTFSTLDEAVAGAERIRKDYPAQRQAARAFAEQHLDSDRVLARMLEQAGVG